MNPDSWRIVRLGDVAETSLGKMLDAARPKGSIVVPYLRNVNVQWGRIDLNDVYEVPLDEVERERFALRPGDLLVCEGGDIGRAALWHGERSYMAYQKALHRVRALTEELDLRYLRYLLEHYANSGRLREYATGSTILHLPQQRLRELLIPLPPLSDQQRLVETLDALMMAEVSVQKLLARSAGLRRAIFGNTLSKTGLAETLANEGQS